MPVAVAHALTGILEEIAVRAGLAFLALSYIFNVHIVLLSNFLPPIVTDKEDNSMSYYGERVS